MGICRSASTSMVFAKLVNPLLCLIIGFALLYFGREILEPLAFACLVALLLITPCKFFEKQGFPRGISALISMLLAFIVFIVIFYYISISVVSFKQDLPLMIQNINESIRQLEMWAQKSFHVSRENMKSIVEDSTNNILPSTSSIINQTVTTVTNVFFLGIILFITTFLLLLYRGLIVKFFVMLCADEYTGNIHTILNRIQVVIRSYIVGLLVEMIIIAIAYCSVFLFLGVRYALLLGVIGAIVNIIPYLGVIITCVLTALITLTTNSPSTVMWSVVSIIIIHMLDTNILMPRIMISRVNINALTSIVGVITGSALWGLPGTFMAMPILAVLKVVFEEVEPLRPFAVLMGDDTDEGKSFSKPVINKISRSVRGRKAKK
jgi:predicted PurR-regulated permease PerM